MLENAVKKEKQHVFIIGSKGIPAKYGGFETFVEKLTLHQKCPRIQYHVSCMVDSKDFNSSKQTFMYNGAECTNIGIKDMGPAKAVIYDINALKYYISYARNKNINNPIFYVLACRIGPFIKYFQRQIRELGGHLYVNPDGHEWKREKWSTPVRKYWKFSEQLMVKYAELIICDSKNIEKYIKEEYKRYCPHTTFIAYGADTTKSMISSTDEKISSWYSKKGVSPKQYYLVVGRFVPENNYETMIREFMKSNTTKDLVLITGIEGNSFYEKLKKNTQFDSDSRIKFVGTVYDQDILKKIREDAYGYLHGHEVGGTNPSLLEALSSTNLNLLLNVGFNREVGELGALYWDKDEGNLATLIEKADLMNKEEIDKMSEISKKRIMEWYSWSYIIDKYEKVFTSSNLSFEV